MDSYTIASLISDAHLNSEKLPAAGALISCGLFEAVAALHLIISKAPQGIFLHHGMEPFIFYYSFLVAVVIFGLFEAWAGLWVSNDLVGRRAAGKMILWFSIAPLVFVVAALEAFAILNVK